MAILIPAEVPVNGGLTVAGVAAAAGGDEAPTGDGRLLQVKFASAGTGTVTVTVATPGTVRGLAISDVTKILNPGDVWVLPLTSEFRDPVTGRAAISYTAVANVTVAVLEPER